MADEPTPETRLSELMDERRTDLELRWEDVADLIGISETGLRRLRHREGMPRKLTCRGIERAMGWTRGSVERIVLDNGDPELSDEKEAPRGLEAECEYERRILSAPGDRESKRPIIDGHRLDGHSTWCQPYAQQAAGAVAAVLGA